MDEIATARAELERQYSKFANRRTSPVPQANNVEDVAKFAQETINAFESRRYDKSLGDKIRTTIGNNLGVLSTVVNQFASAATSSFPPCAPVFTAFNYVVNAAAIVKADYNTLDIFFGDVGSQLGNISIIQNVLGSINLKQLSDAVTSIYAAALTASAIAIKYMRKGRFIQGLRGLILGNDKVLNDAYSRLSAASKKLREVVSFATLDVGERGRLENREGFANLGVYMMTQFDQLNQLVTGGESPLSKLKKYFEVSFKELKIDQPSRILLSGTGQWPFEEVSYRGWENEALPCLWILGSQGSGKSFLATAIVQRLENKFRDLRRTTVASCFFSDDGIDSQSIRRALVVAILQAAKNDETYAKRVLAELDEGRPLDWEQRSVRDIWAQFFAKQYPKQSESSYAKLWLIVDGLEAARNADNIHCDLLELFASIKDQELSIHVVSLVQPVLERDIPYSHNESIPSIIEISGGKNSRYMSTFIDSEMAGRRFKSFEQATLSKIREKLCKEKNFSYVRSALQEIALQTQDQDALDQLRE